MNLNQNTQTLARCGAFFGSLVAFVLSGCAVSSQEVADHAEKAETTAANIQKTAATQREQEPPFLRIHGNYLGAGEMPLPEGLTLPAQFRNVVLNFGRGGDGTFAEAAKNIRTATGLVVRFNADVYATLPSPNGTVNPAPTVAVAANPAPAVGAVPLPSGGPLPAGGVGAARATGFVQAAPTQAPMSPATTLVPLSFRGDLADYLNIICGAAGLSWHYEPGGLYFYHLTTRSFSVQLAKRSIDSSDLTTGGGQSSAATGSSGGAPTGGTLSATSSSTTTMATKFDPWAEFTDTIRTQLSPWGKVSANAATGTFVITDTKSVVDRIATFIASENAKLDTRIDVEIRTISVAVNDGAQLGANFNVVYQVLSAGVGSAAKWGISSVAGSSAVSTTSGVTAGSIGYTNSNPNSRWDGSSLSLQAISAFGKVVSDSTRVIHTRNRVPGQYQKVTDLTYLAQTTPAAGGGTSGGTGVPGLTPGLLTYGSFLTVTPFVSDDGSVTVEFSDTDSNLVSQGTAQTGSGATLQQIALPLVTRSKNTSDLVIPKGASAISVGDVGDSWNSTHQVGVTGGSANLAHNKVISITVVTPYVYPGV